MIREALDDAGLTLADVDGVCCSGIATGIAEYLDLHPTYVDGTFVGGSSFEVHVEHAAAAIASRALRRRGRRLRVHAPARPSPRRVAGVVRPDGPGRRRRVGGAVRADDADDVVRARRRPAHGAVRHHVGAAGADRGRHPPVGGDEPARAVPRPDHRRRRARLARAWRHRCTSSTAACAPTVPARTCSPRPNARAISRQPPVYVLGAATATDHWVISQMPDLTVTPGAVSGPAAFAHAGVGPGDVDVLAGLRLVHHHRAAAPRGPRLLRQGRGRRVRGGRHARARRRRCRRTPTAAGSRTRTRGSTGSSCSSRRCGSCGGSAGERQVADAEIAVAHGCGGVLSATGTVVLGTEATL